MLDWSQPVHAYDAKKIEQQKLVARMAKNDEGLMLLDGQELKLTKQDLVIADGKRAVGLAGVMGGLYDSIGSDTTTIFFESAHFSSVFIRRTSMRHGIRTDSSARFEKTLDPNQITDAILRFVSLAEQTGLKPKPAGDIICVGKPFKEKTIGVTHSFLEKRAGVLFKKDDIIDPLSRIGFTVTSEPEVIGDKNDILYTITIPSFRGAKDVAIKEDILEEVVRFFGFDKIALQLPEFKKEPHDMTPLFRLRKIKEFFVRAARMTEQLNYIYFYEDFLQEAGLAEIKPPVNEQPSASLIPSLKGVPPVFDGCLSITNPVSENNVRIVTTLLPNLFKNIKHNCQNEDRMRFFECGRTARVVDDLVIEDKKVAGIFFEKRKSVDFYECKQHIVDLLRLCGITEFTWKKIDKKNCEYPWIMLYQSAELFCENTKFGTVGKVDKEFLQKLDALEESDAFFFELNLDHLLIFPVQDLLYSPLSKFQGITFDLCFMMPLHLTVNELETVLFDSDDLIERVELIDFFDVDKRSATFRLWVAHPEKTLSKEEIDDVRDNALRLAGKLGAQLRGLG